MPPPGKSLCNRGPSFSLQVARQLQPSVLWIGDTEKTFYKKVPKAEREVRASPSCLSWAFPLLLGVPAPGATSAFGRGRDPGGSHLSGPWGLVSTGKGPGG